MNYKEHFCTSLSGKYIYTGDFCLKVLRADSDGITAIAVGAKYIRGNVKYGYHDLTCQDIDITDDDTGYKKMMKEALNYILSNTYKDLGFSYIPIK